MRGRILAVCGLVGLAVLGLVAPNASGQRIENIYFPKISLFDPTLYSRPDDGAYLASVLPPYLLRPMDDLTPRAGAQAMSMGGAHVALAEGVLALAWNPAGLAGLEGPSLCVDGYSTSSSGSGSDLPEVISIQGFGDFAIRSYGSSMSPMSAFGLFGAARPLLDLNGTPLVGGVAYRRHTEVGYGQETLLQMGLAGEAGASFPLAFGIESDERGFIESLTFGAGYQLIHGQGLSLAVGSTANILTGRLRSESLARVAVRNFEEGIGQFQQDYAGLSIEAGALATISENVRLGAWVGLPHTIAVENGRLMDQPISTPDAMITYRSYWEIADYDLEVPLFATLGLAVGPIRGVEIAADYNLRPWSEVEIKHHDEAFRAYDGAYPAADVESFHMGGRFEFPLFRKPLHAAGLRLNTMIGFRALPLSMRETDLTLGADAAPHYQGDQVSGDATSIGLTLETGQVNFHTGLEFQSFDYHTWFLNDERGVGTAEQRERELWFGDPMDRMISVSRNDTIFRFTAELKL